MILRYLIIGITVFLSLGVLGIDVKNFTLVASALGLGIGFGLKDIVSNFIAGIILAFEQPLKAGDVIEVGGIMGIVGKIGIRSSKVRSYDGADISVPNNTLLSNELVNWTHQDLKRRLDLRISTEYGIDPNKVLDIIKKAAENYPKTINDPPPLAIFQKFGDSSLDFRLLSWVPVDNGLAATSDVYLEI
jgi:small-conductance mechanosensitive channel